jgi:hypothetical protein
MPDCDQDKWNIGKNERRVSGIQGASIRFKFKINRQFCAEARFEDVAALERA